MASIRSGGRQNSGVRGLKRAKTLISAAEHSIGSREAQEAARIEVAYLLDDIERYTKRVKDLIELLDQKLAEIPHVDKLLAVPGLEAYCVWIHC